MGHMSIECRGMGEPGQSMLQLEESGIIFLANRRFTNTRLKIFGTGFRF